MRSCGAYVPVADRRVPDLPRVQAKIAFVSDRLASRRGPGMSLNLRSDHNLNYVIPRVVLQNFLIQKFKMEIKIEILKCIIQRYV